MSNIIKNNPQTQLSSSPTIKRTYTKGPFKNTTVCGDEIYTETYEEYHEVETTNDSVTVREVKKKTQEQL